MERHFKYRPLGNTEELNHTIDIFKNSTLYFSGIKNFNDPFEFIFKNSFRANLEDKLKWAQEFCKNDLIKLDQKLLSQPRNQQKKWFKKFEDKKKNDSTIADEVKNNYGVCCFSNSSDNIHMWSHYASSHSGICIEFDPEKDTSFFKKSLKVEYKNKIPVLKFYDINLSSKENTNWVYTKYKLHWKQENEFRIFNKEPNKSIKFNKESIKSVSIGINFDLKKSYTLMEIIKDNYPNIDVILWKNSTTTYSLVELNKHKASNYKVGSQEYSQLPEFFP